MSQQWAPPDVITPNTLQSKAFPILSLSLYYLYFTLNRMRNVQVKKNYNPHRNWNLQTASFWNIHKSVGPTQKDNLVAKHYCRRCTRCMQYFSDSQNWASWIKYKPTIFFRWLFAYMPVTAAVTSKFRSAITRTKWMNKEHFVL